MYKRTYFSKDNTITYKSEFNYGNLPIVDLFYGGGVSNPNFSRYLFQFDVEELKRQFLNCELGDLSQVKHYLNFKHSGFTQKANACMPNSYTICLFKIHQPWDEGCGVSNSCAQGCTSFAELNCTVDKSPSNWFYSQSDTLWDIEGVYDSLYTIPYYLLCQEVNCNSLDLRMDVTDIVNDLISNNVPNYGFGLAFHYDLERELNDTENHVVFFGKETNTFYEPYLETEYVNAIYDDRAKFYLDKLNRLYLYATVDGEPVKLDENPIVNIYDETNALQFTLTGTCQDLGIYYVEFEIDSANIDKCYAWKDVWTAISINGKSLPNQSFKFNILPASDYYGFGYNTPVPITNFHFSFRGIQRDEIIKQGDVRKIFVDIKSPSNPTKSISVDNVFYKVYLKEGNYDEVTIIDWMPLNRGVCENWFLLDTSWMIPQTYIIDFKVVNKQTVKTYENKIKFNVITNQIFF
jgi:hypothetical protein